MRICWQEKELAVKKELYSREKASYYNRKDWAMKAIEDVKENGKDKKRILIKKRDIQRQVVDMRIRKAIYNSKYKNIDLRINKPRYLMEKNMDNILVGIRALIKFKCGNMKENNKY